jgi:hypothetical protein
MKLSNLRKEMDIQMDIHVHEAFRIPNTHDQKKASAFHIMLNCQEHRAKTDYRKMQERRVKIFKKANLSE